MSLLRIKEYLKRYGLQDRIMEFSVSSATVEDASVAIGCDKDEIVKTLSFIVGDKPILIAVSGNSKIDNSKFKKEFNVKARMIPANDVERLVGHGVGGVCPIGVNENVDIYLDTSLKKHTTLYPAAGTSSSAVKLTLDELEKVSNYKSWVDVSKEKDK